MQPPNVEVRHAPHRSRPEYAEVPEQKKTILQQPMTLPDGQKLPSGSNRYALYGALEDVEHLVMKENGEKLKGRRRINCNAALNALFFPWALFLIVFCTASFYLHYESPFLVLLLNGLALVGSLYCMYRSSSTPNPNRDRTFYSTYMAIACVIAVSLGWLLGDLNFWFNMQPAYNIEHLATYTNVNPSATTSQSGQQVPTSGKRYQDAGKVYFEHNAMLDLRHAMSFKMGDLYCAAPIVDPQCNGTCGFDFWAVGVNCCSEDVADFRCGEYSNPTAKAGLRLMHDEQRANFRMAVLKAQGVHKVTSTHPVFFHWLHDPVKEIDHIKRKGFRGFALAMIASFGVNALVTSLWLKCMREQCRLT